jgi:hypothetical protein
MTTLTLVIALMLTAGSIFLTSVLASRYGINDESVFFRRLTRVVTINDRGPFVRGRMLNLTPAAARAIAAGDLAHVFLSQGNRPLVPEKSCWATGSGRGPRPARQVELVKLRGKKQHRPFLKQSA